MLKNEKNLTIEKFSCCSLWQECQKTGYCVQQGNNVISREEYLKNCSMAQRYRFVAKKAQENQNTEPPKTPTKEMEQLSLF